MNKNKSIKEKFLKSAIEKAKIVEYWPGSKKDRKSMNGLDKTKLIIKDKKKFDPNRILSDEKLNFILDKVVNSHLRWEVIYQIKNTFKELKK